MNKKIILILILTLSFVYAFFCDVASCDPSIHYAMSKQRDVINKRFGDLIHVIEANDAEEAKQTLYLTKEGIEAMRLKFRVKMDLYLIMKQNHITSNIKDAEANKY